MCVFPPRIGVLVPAFLPLALEEVHLNTEQPVGAVVREISDAVSAQRSSRALAWP